MVFLRVCECVTFSLSCISSIRRSKCLFLEMNDARASSVQHVGDFSLYFLHEDQVNEDGIMVYSHKKLFGSNIFTIYVYLCERTLRRE